MEDIEIMIRHRVGETLLVEGVNALVPCAWSLFQAVVSLPKTVDHGGGEWINKTSWLIDVYFFVKVAIERGGLYVHLINGPLIVSSQSNGSASNGHPSCESEGLTIINIRMLSISFGD